MEGESVKLTLPDGKSIEFDKSLIKRSTYLQNFTEQFSTNEVPIKPPATKPFQMKSLETVKKFLEKYPAGEIDLPKKPFLAITNWEDYLEKKPGLADILKIDNFYEIVDLFNCANYLKVNDLIQLVAAKIAYCITHNRQSGEDHLREFDLVTKYPVFFTEKEENDLRDKEFANSSSFEGVIDYYSKLEDSTN